MQKVKRFKFELIIEGDDKTLLDAVNLEEAIENFILTNNWACVETHSIYTDIKTECEQMCSELTEDFVQTFSDQQSHNGAAWHIIGMGELPDGVDATDSQVIKIVSEATRKAKAEL